MRCGNRMCARFLRQSSLRSSQTHPSAPSYPALGRNRPYPCRLSTKDVIQWLQRVKLTVVRPPMRGGLIPHHRLPPTLYQPTCVLSDMHSAELQASHTQVFTQPIGDWPSCQVVLLYIAGIPLETWLARGEIKLSFVSVHAATLLSPLCLRCWLSHNFLAAQYFFSDVRKCKFA